MYPTPYQQYSQQSFTSQPLNVQVATSLKKVVNLIQEGKQASDDMQFDVKFEKIEQATKIIMLLQDSFTQSDVPEIKAAQKNLTDFYGIILTLLDKVAISNDMAAADVAIKSVSSMAKTWFELKAEPQEVEMPSSLAFSA